MPWDLRAPSGAKGSKQTACSPVFQWHFLSLLRGKTMNASQPQPLLPSCKKQQLMKTCDEN